MTAFVGEAIEERRAICEADGVTGAALAAAIEHTRAWAERIERGDG